MITTVLVASMMLAQPAQRTDTTFAVQQGGRISVNALNGTAVVRAWDRQAVRIQAAHPADARVAVTQRGGTVNVESQRGRGGPVRTEYEITVPRSFGVVIEALNMPVTVQDVDGAVRITNVEGAIVVRGTSGRVALESVSGEITVDDASGTVSANTVNRSIRLTRIRGDITADAVNGSIVMRSIEASRVQASTINGEIDYSGVFRDGGRYYLGTHNGRVTVAVPEDAGVTFSISTHRGQVEAAFPVPVTGIRDGHLRFVLGSGRASVELESFNGSVRLIRPTGRL
ncbi:hypothetical protein BH23GEM9_BH23GEM9_31430 [soil metagenome]